MRAKIEIIIEVASCHAMQWSGDVDSYKNSNDLYPMINTKDYGTLEEKLGNDYLISGNFGMTQEFRNYYYAVQ